MTQWKTAIKAAGLTGLNDRKGEIMLDNVWMWIFASWSRILPVFGILVSGLGFIIVGAVQKFFNWMDKKDDKDFPIRIDLLESSRSVRKS